MKGIVVGIIVGVAVALVGAWWFRRRLEKFTVHEKSGCTKITPTDQLPPTSDRMNVVLQPGSVRLAVQGYNYQEEPAFYPHTGTDSADEFAEKITPIEYARDSDDLTYFFTLPYSAKWIMETFDFVQPTVINQDTGKKLTVQPLRRRHGYNRWLIS